MAAALDVVENLALAKGLGPAPQHVAEIARGCAIPKFALIGLILLFVLGATTLLIARRVRQEPDTWPLPLLWVTPLGTWILSYPVLLGVTVLVLGVVWRAFLAGLGIPDLFWHESMGYQFLAGLGTGMLVADLGLIGFLLDAPSAWMKRLGRKAGSPGTPGPPSVPWCATCS